MKRTVVATLTAFTLISCSPSWSADLTRPQAKAILSKTKTFTSAYNQLPFVDNGVQEFVAEGGTNNPEFVKVFAKVTPGTVFNIGDAAANTITLRTPLPARVDEITGIADAGQGMKEVHFHWSIVNVPNVLKPFVAVGGTGRAIMRLYDDGWRVENGPSLVNDTTFPVLTPAQVHQVALFKQEAHNFLEEHRREEERQEQLRKEKLEAARKPTKILYHFRTKPGDEVDITDVGLTVTNGDKSKDPKLYLWADDMKLLPAHTVRDISGFMVSNLRRIGFGFTFETIDEANQAHREIQKSYDAWVATYGNL